ncbi:MAG: hypothetical protein Q8R92_20830 [Deltaproteobacteria bacterium]|nr:hypothetical protein [Deltaproteobacteria bacterium]
MAYARIAITLPKSVLAAADRRAKQLDRSRSRVIVDALRAYLTGPSAVRESPQPAYGSDAVGVARREQLERDLARSPAERLRVAEATSRLAQSRRRRRGAVQQIIGFDSYEDFYEWKRANRG